MNHKQGIEWITSAQKRAMEKALVLSTLPITIPTLALAGAGVVVIDRMNPAFTQPRTGRGFEPFTMAKIRTMPPTTNANLPSYGCNDPHATRFGKHLRRTHVDELPQLFHVIVGDMAIVGPRPLLPSQVEETMEQLSPKEQAAWTRARQVARPGLAFTCNGLQHTQGKMNSYSDRAMAEIDYLHTASAAVDWRIIASNFSDVANDLANTQKTIPTSNRTN